jgi:DNA-directed RNA polymerase subunit RPC12/RpoP
MSDDLLSPVSPRNPAQQIHADPPKVNIQQVQEQEIKYIEGAELVPLPSKGVFYNYDQRYINLESLQVRQLNYTDEDILTTKSYFDNGTLFNELLKNVIVDPNGFPADGLVPVDRETILIWLRSTAFGNDFEIEYKCSQCGALYPVTWDLGKLSIPEYPEEIYGELSKFGELTIETPIKRLKVKITVPSIGKSLKMEKALSQKKLANKTTQDYFGTGALRLLVSGVEVENNKVLRKGDEIMNYFTKVGLPISDARYIRKMSEKINLKYDTKQTVVCPACSHSEEGVEMPLLHPNFLWAGA